MRQKIVSFVFMPIAILVALGFSFYYGSTATVKLYYYSPTKDVDEAGNILCSEKGLQPVDRVVPVAQDRVEDVIKLLMQGQLTEVEKESGLTTQFPLPGLALTDVRLGNGVLTLIFDDPQNKSSGGSCRAAVLWKQIEATAKQFSEVQSVRFEPEWIFQP